MTEGVTEGVTDGVAVGVIVVVELGTMVGVMPGVTGVTLATALGETVTVGVVLSKAPKSGETLANGV